MTGAERGFLLLTSSLGDPARKPLTAAQFRELTQRVKDMTSREGNRDVTPRDFIAMGYKEDFARHITGLLQDEELLEYYLLQAKKAECFPITRASECYPIAVRKRLGLDSPGVLWAKGEASLLNLPKVALVGSRDLQSDNAAFAREVGRQAAIQGYALVSGNARGADKIAQNACLEHGGKVISVVADTLLDHTRKEHVLYLSENSFDEPFSAQRAISRNRVIHALGEKTFVAQSDFGHGGTWDGTVKNLRGQLSAVYCFRDESPAQRQFVQMGATAVDMKDLEDMAALAGLDNGLFDQ